MKASDVRKGVVILHNAQPHRIMEFHHHTPSSSAIKFCDGNMNAIRNVTIDNCVIRASNRGIAFMNFDGGVVSDVVLSNLTIECTRRDWFWWGDGDPIHFNIKRRSEVHKSIKPSDDKNPAGKIRRVLITNVIASGYGSSICNGHPDSWLEDITLNNVHLTIAHDASAPYDKAKHALVFQKVKNLKLKDLSISWEGQHDKWESALVVEEVTGLQVDGFSGSSFSNNAATIKLNQVDHAVIRNSTSEAQTFLYLEGAKSKDILLTGNDLRLTKVPYQPGKGVSAGAVRLENNITGK